VEAVKKPELDSVREQSLYRQIIPEPTELMIRYGFSFPSPIIYYGTEGIGAAIAWGTKTV
jgi:hypothetical protein